MQSKSVKKDWNELEFLSWQEFKQMTPTIIQLEITRLSKLIDKIPLQTDFRNALVKARFDLKKFTECLQETVHPPLPDTCVSNLQTAILAVSIENIGIDSKTTETLQYVLDRLNYVYNRIRLIY